jgi:hypothetical protein
MSKPEIKLNSKGKAVEELTKALKQRGYLDKISTVFDRTVRAAVIEFQSRHLDERGRPLKVDGIVGPLTWWALENKPSDVIVPTPLTKMPRSGGSPRGRKALEAALSEMNKGAKEIGGNNKGPWVKKYLNNLAPEGSSWCAGFVSWCFFQHSDGIPFRYSVGARDIRNQFKNKGWLYDVTPGNQPQPGDIVVWWRGQKESWKGHIGLVHHATDGGILYTIEGNKGNFPAPVSPFDYVLGRMDRLLGFGRVY